MAYVAIIQIEFKRGAQINFFMKDHRDSVTLSRVKSDQNYYVSLFSYTDVTQFENNMVILPGSKSLWQATFHDVVEAVRLQLGFDYYFG